MRTNISEKSFESQILQLAHLAGWRTYHTHDSRRSAPGFPDIVLCRPPEIVFAELKSETGKPTAAQLEWLEALDRCEGVVAKLWRPGMWPEIEETLCKRGEARRGA